MSLDEATHFTFRNFPSRKSKHFDSRNSLYLFKPYVKVSNIGTDLPAKTGDRNVLHLTFLQYWNIEFHPSRLSIHITCDRNSIKPIGYFNGMVRTQLRKYGGMFQLLWRQDSSLWIFIMVGNTETRPTRSLYYVAAVLMVETRWCSLFRGSFCLAFR